jgi:hypothetical protein
MATYLLTYRAPKDYRGGGEDAIATWQSWLRDLGDALIDPGNPVFSARRVGVTLGDTTLGGYSLVKADDMDAAVALAEGCPFVGVGGGVEVGEVTPRNGGRSLATTPGDHLRFAHHAA